MEKKTTYPRFRWFILLTVVTGYATVGLLQVAPTAVLKMISEDLGISVGQVSAVFTGAYVFACATSAILSGFIIDRFGFTPSVIGGSVLALASSILILFVDSTGGAVAARILTGFAAGPISACVSYVAVRWFPPRERGIFTGFQGSGIPIGIAVAFAAMAVAVRWTNNWRSSLALLSIAPLIMLVFSVITAFVREPGSSTSEKNTDSGTGSIKHVFRQLPFYAGVFCMFAFMWMQQSFTDLTPGYISIPEIGLGLDSGIVERCMSIAQGGMILGSVLCGFILEKIFRGKTKPLIMAGFIFAAISILSIRFEFIWGNAALLTASFFSAGFFEGFIMPMIAAFISMNYPRNIVGKVFGISFGICLFGGTIGVFAGSALVHYTGHYNTSIIIVGIMGFAGFISALGLNRMDKNI